MTDFLSRPSNPPAEMSARKEGLMNSVRQELALANAQELMNKANDKCFTKCVTKPGDSLSNSEQNCLSRCLDRYMEAFDIVSRTYTARVTKQRMEGQAAAALQDVLS